MGRGGGGGGAGAGGGRGGRRGRRGSGRAAVDRSHSRPVGAPSPAAESGRRTAGLISRLLAAKGVTVADVARALGVRPVDIGRWRRGTPIPGYRRAELESRLERLEVVSDEETGRPVLRLRP